MLTGADDAEAEDAAFRRDDPIFFWMNMKIFTFFSLFYSQRI